MILDNYCPVNRKGYIWAKLNMIQSQVRAWRCVHHTWYFKSEEKSEEKKEKKKIWKWNGIAEISKDSPDEMAWKQKNWGPLLLWTQSYQRFFVLKPRENEEEQKEKLEEEGRVEEEDASLSVCLCLYLSVSV